MVKKAAIIAVGAALAFALGFSVNQLIAKDGNEAIHDDEARELAESLYGGRIQTFIQKGNRYEMTLENEWGVYELEIDRSTGEIASLALMKKKVQPPDEEDPPSAAEQNEKPRAKIGKKRAAEIALTKVKGEVDDVDLEEFDGSHAYAVEIETDEEDALVYVQAYTGEILSVTFED